MPCRWLALVVLSLAPLACSKKDRPSQEQTSGSGGPSVQPIDASTISDAAPDGGATDAGTTDAGPKPVERTSASQGQPPARPPAPDARQE